MPGFNNGRLVKVSWGPNPSQNSDTLAYDAEGRLKKQTRKVNDQTFIYEVTVYDTLDRPTSVKLPSGEVVTTTYDEEGVNTLAAGATSLISKVGYNERGQLAFLERPGAGPETTLSYYGAADNFRLSGITNSGDGNLPDFSYGNYDAIGNLTQFTAGADSYTYTYDDLNRLKKVTGAIGRDYTYDLLGNFDSVTKGGQVQDYTYAADNASRLMSVSNLPLTVDASEGYDTWGNLRKYTLQGVAYELTFNAENRLASVKVGTAQPTVFAYDADGQRVQTTYPNGTIIYTPFPDYEVEDPLTGANTVRTTYRLAGQIIAVQTKVGTAAGTFYYTYTDHLGNVTALSTTAGAFVTGSKARYDPFGTFTTTTPTSNPSISNHGFTGHRHNNTGTNDLDLIYMNARYYMPLVGRFISPDTIVPEPGNPQSYNRYAYSINNPVKYIDPSGHWFESVLDLAFIAYDIYDIQQNGLNWTNGLSLAVDIGGLALPVVTGGGLAVRALAHGDDLAKVATHVDDFGPVKAAIEALKAGDTAPMKALQHWQQPIVRGFVSEAKMLEKLGYAGSAKKTISALVDGKMVTTIPDYFDEGAKIIGEIKDVAELQGTVQIKAQLAWAREHSYQYRIHVQPGTKIPQWLLKFWEDNRSWFKIMGDVTGLE